MFNQGSKGHSFLIMEVFQYLIHTAIYLIIRTISRFFKSPESLTAIFPHNHASLKGLTGIFMTSVEVNSSHENQIKRIRTDLECTKFNYLNFYDLTGP